MLPELQRAVLPALQRYVSALAVAECDVRAAHSMA